MKVEYFIAKRMATSREGGRPSVMERVARVAVALSVVAMIISLAVVYGFKRELGTRLTSFTSDALISNVATLNNVADKYITRSAEIEQIARSNGAERINPYVVKHGVVRNAGNVEGVVIKGVDPSYDWQFISSSLVEGELPAVSDSLRTRDVLISQSLASKIGVGVGSRLETLFSDEEHGLRRDLFKVSGIYSTGLDQWDNLTLFGDVRSLQRLNGWSAEQVSGYELYFGSLDRASSAMAKINEELFYSDIEGAESIVAVSAERLYPQVFDWLKTHDVNALVIIIIMIVVAGFNMATALLIMVFERTRMIAILKSLGMTNRSLRRIFLFRAARISVVGLVVGNVIGLGLCLLQQHFRFIELDTASYMIRYVPIDLSAWWLILLNMVVVAIIMLLMILPTHMVSRVKIEKRLNFE